MRAIEGSGLHAYEVRGRDGSPMARLFSLIALGDYVSVYVAIRRGVDPSPVPVLTKVKEELRS
jgi:glucose/mannose-6-phosphate isomerase